jgi:hypothetical protein
MILMRFRHLLPVGVAATALSLGITSMASAQSAQRPPAGKPAAKPAAAAPAAKPGTPAATAQKPAAAAGKPTAAKPAPGKPAAAAPSAAPGGVPATLLASFGDWGVYTAQSGRTKICYALTQPKDRQPKTATRDPAYLFVSFRPAENVKNEVAFVMGYPTKDNGAAEASIGATNYVLLTKEANAWLKNPAEEGQAITTMSRNQALVVKAQSRKGTQLTDRYSLTGFGPALERARKECS